MNNTSIAPILEAVGELDNEILESTFNSKRKKPFLLVAIAAAAALSLLVGFTAAVRHHSEINGEPMIDLNIKIHDDYVIPPLEEMIELGAENIVVYDEDGIRKPGDYDYSIANISPSTVIEKYGFKSFINEHFTENVSLYDLPREIVDREDIEEVLMTFKLYPMYVGVYENGIHTNFWLIDNESALPVFVINNHYIGELDGPIISQHTEHAEEYEIIELNDGNKALIKMSAFLTGEDHLSAMAEFSYDGDYYMLVSPVDINGMKRIMANFGFTSE